MLPGWPLLLLLQNAPTIPMTAPASVKVQASVLRVRGKLGGIQGRQGSGVVVGPGLVATNAHVVEGTHDLTVQQGPMIWLVSAVWVDRNRDLCLLTVPGLTAPPVEMAPAPATPGQAVMAVGYPGGQGPVVSRGRLRGIWHHEEGLLLQSDALTLPGSSGGGLFDEEGRLLGLTTLTFTPSPRLNFSVPVAWIQTPPPPEGEGDRTPLGHQEDRVSDLLERLAKDPRNWPAWESAARQWVLDLPRDESAWLALGLALDHSARASAEAGQGASDASSAMLAESVAAYRRSLSLRRSPKAWNNLGVALDLLNRFEEAEQAFAEALAMEPAYALAWLNLGGARVNAGRHALAVEALQRGLALRPDEVDAWVRLAHCQRMLRQPEAALATMQIALRYRPLGAELWLDLGLLLVELARLDEARAVHARLVSMNPELAVRLQASLQRSQSVRPPAGALSRPH